MKTTVNYNLSELMKLAWSFVKTRAYSMQEALKCAWANFKLYARLKSGIVGFIYMKTNGEKRIAYGTLSENKVPETQGTGRRAIYANQTYFDTEKNAWREFKKANLLAIL